MYGQEEAARLHPPLLLVFKQVVSSVNMAIDCRIRTIALSSSKRDVDENSNAALPLLSLSGLISLVLCTMFSVW